jgi:hypothetical protein
MTAPMVPPDADLGHFPWFPILRTRLFNSSFNAKATDTEWRAGVTLWIKSYDQLPSGSLPNDDIELWRLTEVKGNLRTWHRIKPMALHGWVLCDDDRLYHPLISLIINSANIEKVSSKLNVNGGGNAPRAMKGKEKKRAPPLAPPTNGGGIPPLRFRKSRQGPMTTLHEGGARAADAWIARQERSAGSGSAGDKTAGPLLDGPGTRRRTTGAD